MNNYASPIFYDLYLLSYPTITPTSTCALALQEKQANFIAK